MKLFIKLLTIGLCIYIICRFAQFYKEQYTKLKQEEAMIDSLSKDLWNCQHSCPAIGPNDNSVKLAREMESIFGPSKYLDSIIQSQLNQQTK